jgi:hypothetical protein
MKKAYWTGDTLRRNCLLKHVIEGEMEQMRRGRRTRNRILDDRKKRRKHWKLKRTHLIAVSGKYALEETTDLSQHRLRDDDDDDDEHHHHHQCNN